MNLENTKPIERSKLDLLKERLQVIDMDKEHSNRYKPQASRFSKLTGLALEIAIEGIENYLKKCDEWDVAPEGQTITEFIDDALKGKRTRTDEMLSEKKSRLDPYYVFKGERSVEKTEKREEEQDDDWG